MSINNKKLWGLVILTTMAGISLTACANPLANVTEQAVEQAIEAESGGDIDIDAGGGASMPEGWPSSIPAPSGKITMSASEGSEGSKNWTIVVTVSNSEEAFNELADKIKAAGFEATTEAVMEDGSYGAYQNSEYMINMTATTSEGVDPTVTMVVMQSPM